MKEELIPLPSDEKIVQLANDLLAQFDTIFGLHPGFRPAHAKGMMLSGTFAPSPEARSLTRAPHVTRESTPVTVRFSNGSGLPLIPDNVPDSNPRGLAIRFHLADRVHTDIVSHSTDGFPTRLERGRNFSIFSEPRRPGILRPFWLHTQPRSRSCKRPSQVRQVLRPKPILA
jgi:Catalase